MTFIVDNRDRDLDAESRENRRSRLLSIAKALIKLSLTALVVYFAGNQLVKHWSDVEAYPWTLNPVLIGTSFAMHLLTFLLFSKTWCMLMPAFGHSIPLRYGFKVSYIANLGRYIPGKIWPIIGQVYLLGKMGVGKKTAFVSWTVAMFYGLPSAFLASALTVWLYPEMGLQPTAEASNPEASLLLLIALTMALFCIFLPSRITSLANWILRLLKRSPMNFNMTVGIGLRVYIGYSLSWIAYGVSFFTFLHGIMESPPIPLTAGIGSFVTAYLIGYLAIFAPGGIGARELVLTSILSPFLGPVATGVAVAARLWNLLAEVLAAAIALAIPIRQHGRSRD